MVTDNTSQADDTTAFLRAARSGNLEKVIEFLDTDLDINTANSNGLNALHLASKDGHVEIVTELLKRSAKVDASTKKGNTALHIASLAGQAEIVNILIQYGAAVNIQSQNGFTPLYMAAQENHDQVVKLLLSNGANQSLATEDGFTPLAVAMQQGHDKVVSVLLENDSKGKVRLPALHIAAKKDDCKAADLLLQNDHKPDVTSKSGFTPLHIAAHYGNEEIARLLIKRGADVNYIAKHNISPLHVAAKWGKNNMVKVLLENSAQIDAKTRDGLTPLHCAARSGHEQVITTLLEHSAPISARTKNGLAPLHMASQGDHVDAARVLLYHRAPVDEVTIDYLTSLHVAAHCGHVRVAKLLLDRKADPNARALNGFTPLHIACKKNRIKVVELLLKHGASIESTTESGLTPLHVASFMGCMNIVIFLLQHEANPDVPTVRGETPLHLAARANQTDIIRILLRNGAKVDARAREQQTPLHIASRLGNIVIVMLLLQHGAAVDTTTKNMYTALHIAAKEGQEEVTSVLVDNNASLKATTKNGFTPLHIAAKYGNMSVAKILLQRSSKLDAQGKNDISPLHLACHYDHPNVANLLLEKGASPHLVSQNGHTPLHIAARKNQMEIASTLLESGANANAESKAGFTPLHLSAQKGHYDMTNLLIEHGADPNHKSKNGLSALHLCAQEDFIRVASILVKNGANVETETETGYRPIHVAAHFGHLSMIRFLLKHNADINVKNNQNYTPLHQAAQQGHAHIVTALLEGNASHKAKTNDGLTALNIAQKLGYISVTEVLKGLSYDTLSPDNKNWDEKYKVIAPESLQETNFMSDSDDEGGSDALISEQPYLYLTADLMKSLRDDSLPIDVTRDDPVHRQVTKEGLQEFTQSNNYCLAENFDTDGFNLGRLHFRSFLVSFLVDARGGAMKGCRHSGVRIIVPPRRATMPIRVTCRLIKPNKVANLPPLMEGEALATRIIEMGPIGATFLGPVLIDIPHFASIRGKEREIIILRSENGETWKEHDNSVDNDDTLLNTPYDPQMSATHSGRITRIITTDFPQYFATVTRIKQEVHVIGAEGGILISSVANHVQAVFPPGALTKKIKVGLQAHVIPAELTAKLLGNCVAVSPIITIEPRRRKFHKPITLTIPVPQAANKGMINQYGGETPTLRLLCSIAGGTSESQWEDVTGSTPLTFMNDKVSFTTTVSARFWLMDCRNIGAVSRMATELYEESLYVPYIINFVIYSKRMDALEATLRILCMTDGKEGMHTLERQEEFVEIVKSRDVEALDGKDLYIEFSGNLVPVTKSGVQLKFTFKAFRQNRLSFHVKVKDPLLDPVARMLFMREPKVAKGEPPQQPICVLNIVLPEISAKIEAPKKLKEYEDSNIINQKIDSYKSKYEMEGKEKKDELKEISPSENKFIKDTLQKERTDAVTIHESLAQKAACPLESVDASYPSKVVGDEQELSSTIERQTYKEKRKFWEDISKKRESYQRSESDVSRTSELTLNESDSQYMQNVGTGGTGATSEMEMEKSETMEDLNVPDISECSVAEKAHYFEEQIQKEITKVVPKLHPQVPLKTEKEKSTKGKIGDKERDDDDERYITESHEAKKIEKTHEIISETRDQKSEARKEVEKSVLEDENEKDKIKKMYKDVSEDVVTEKTDEPEKLKEDVEKVDHSIRVQSTEEIAKKEKDESQKIQKSKEQVVEHKEQSSIRTEEKSFERREVLGESSTLVKDQRRESKVKDVTEQHRSVADTIPKQKEGKMPVGDKEEIQRAREAAKEIVTEVKVEKEIVKDAKKKEEVKEPVTEVKVEKEIVKDAKKKQEEVKGPVTEVKIEKEIVKDAQSKQEEVKEVVSEIKIEKEIVKDIKKKQEELKEPVAEVKIEKEIIKDSKKKQEEPKGPVTEVKVEKEIIKDVKKKQEEVKELVSEVKIEKEIIKDVKKEEVKEPIAEIKIEKEIIKDVKKEEVKGPVTEIKIEKEIIKDAKSKQEEVKGLVTEVKIEKEIIKDAKKKQEEPKGPDTEIKIEKEIIKDVKKKQEEAKELVSEVKIEKEIIKEAKKEEVKEPVAEIKIEKEIIKDVKKEVKEPVTEIKIEKEVIKEAKKEEVKEPVAEIKIEKEVVKDVKKKQEEAKELVTEVKVEKELLKDKEEMQKRIQGTRKDVDDFVTGRSIEHEDSRDAKGSPKVKPPDTDVSILKERAGGSRVQKANTVTETSSGRRIITEETTIIYKVQKDGTLVQEQVLKSVQIGEGATDSVGLLSGVSRDAITSSEMYETQSLENVKPEIISSADVSNEIQKFLEGKRKLEIETMGEVEQGASLEILEKLPIVQRAITKEETEVKKEDEETIVKEEPVTEVDTKHVKKESRIPVSTVKADKDKVQKETKPKPGELKQIPSKPELAKDSSSELLDTVSPTGKKKEFESRIPKRVMDVKSTSEKQGQKDTHAKKESETYTITEKKLSEEVTSKLEEHLTTKSETQTFSKTFTDPQDAFEMFEDMDSMKNNFATVTSKVDHKSSSVLEKKEVISSEICSGTDKIITLEEKERVEKKKSSESQVKKESPTETVEEKKSKMEELDKTAIQKMSMNLTDTQEVIDATAAESRAETKKEVSFEKLSDEKGIATHEAGSSIIRESDAEVAIRIKKDISEGTRDKDDIKIIEEDASGERVFKPVTDFDNVEKIVHGESRKETKESFEVSKFTPTEKITKEGSQTEKPEKITQIESLEEAQRQKLNEIEARAIAETLIKSIESEIETKSATDLKTELLSKGYLEQIAREGTEFDHEKLADDLTRKFENIMKKSASRQADKIATDQSSAELPRLRSSMQDESYEKETTRDSMSISEDITKDEESSPPMSPSSISELINFEETIDVDTNELEDISKSVLSTQFDKQRSDKYGSQMESRDLHSEESFPRDKIASEISDVRVLEVLEPGVESQSRQDSVDVPSLEMDEHKISEQTSRGIPSLHESADTDSFERIVQERDITISPSTVSEDTNEDYSLVQEAAQKEHEAISTKRADSFEYESPPILSPKSKVNLEIRFVNWMIGEEKIEISETLQPSQIFNQELEAYESMRKKECLSSQDGSTDYDQESVTKSSEEVSVIESIKETCTDNGPAVPAVAKSTKFTVIPISEQDLESELVENKLGVSCQELVDMLQLEYDAKTPNKEYVESIQQKVATEEVVESEKREEEPVKMEEEVADESASVTAEVDTKKPSETVTRPEIELKLEKVKTTQDATESDGLKEWTEGYLSKIKPSSDEYKRHIEKSTDKHDKSGRSVTVPSDTCTFKIKKDDFSGVDLSARYAITVLDQVVKKEIAEVKESLEAAKQDLIEELSENSETVIQIKDSPSEFQFKLQPESIPNDLPSLYKSSSPERDTEIAKSDSPIAESAPPYIVESKTQAEESVSSGVVDTPIIVTRQETPVIETETETEIETENEKSEIETAIITVHEDTKDDEEGHPSPVPVSRSGSDIDNKDESSSLVLPCPILRRRHKSARASKRVASESEADVGSSSGDSSNYQSCDYEIGSGSRPSSSDIEALQSGCILSATASEYETAMMSIEHSTSSKQTSQEYHTAATTMSSRESMKSLTSLSSGHLGSIDSTSEFSETLVPSEGDAEEKEEIEDDFKGSFEEERTEQSDSSGSDIPIDESMDKIDSHIPYRMKRSSEMIFPQTEDEVEDEKSPTDGKGIDFATSTVTPTSGTLKSVDIMTSRVSEDGIQSVCTQVSSVQTALDVDKEIESKAVDPETIETVLDAQIAEPDFLDQKYPATGPSNESSETSVQISTMQQASMSTSSTSIGSVTTVIGKEKSDRHSPDSDSFEIVDKPDIIDDFVVIEEVGREAKEFDSEGKSIRISSVPIVSSKNYDRDLENLLTESKTDYQETASHSSKNNELFDFESQESPPQASNDDQYSQSYSDDEQFEESKKWVEMLFHVDTRVCGVEYDRGPLEDIKEEEVTDFEAGSSRFGSLGSQKESIGSVGSMRGSFGSTPDYDVLASKKYFVKTAEHDNVSLSSLQEFEHLESAVAAENSKKLQCGSHDSVNNGSLPKRYTASRSGHGDDVSLSSLKDFEGLEKACREAHLIELRAREEEDLLEHESPENRYKLENLTRTRVDTSNVGSFNPSTSGSDDYEKRIKEIDEIIRIAQSNVERFDRQDDTTEDISQIEIMDAEKTGIQVPVQSASKQEETKDVHIQKETNIMETSTDSLELEDNVDIKHHPLCRSSDSLEMKTTLDFPSLSSDSLNNVRDGKEAQSDMVGHASFRRISSDSLDMPLLEQQNVEGHERTSENDNSDGAPSDNSLEQRLETTETDVRSEKARTTPSTGT
ncbi:uncharacterized protein LOC143345812 isoform X3 [Colletes latitarsis]|uniref:uncharacterized protein LOC143345812 isoform X3 n=1 Tax=Colletes latitarsis TaxID=2605962 RepID=UPI00403663E3